MKKAGYTRKKAQRYRCLDCGMTFSDPQPTSPLGVMRIDIDTAVRALQCLLEGCSIRSTERMCGINRNTIMSLLLLAGERCEKLMDSKMKNLTCKFLQSDEIWSFVFKKNKRVRKDDPVEFGDQWIFIALDPETKLIPSYTIGKRTAKTTRTFIDDVASRLANRVQITTDGFRFYIEAIEKAFGADVDFAQLIKLYGDYGQHDSATKYSPSPILEVISKVIQGNPDAEKICTSHVERPELDGQNADETANEIDECVLEKSNSPESSIRVAFRVLQFLPRSSNSARYSLHGGWYRKSHLDNPRVAGIELKIPRGRISEKTQP